MSPDTLAHIIIAVVAAIPPTIAAIAALVVALRSKKHIESLDHKVNDRMDQLLDQAKTIAHAAGRQAERDKLGEPR